MTTIYVIGDFPHLSAWVCAEPFETTCHESPRERDEQDQRAIATISTFLAKTKRSLDSFADDIDLQAVLEVLGANNPTRFTDRDVLAQVRVDLYRIDYAATEGPAQLVSWLCERTRGSASNDDKPMPNPWFDAQSHALSLALGNRGRIIDRNNAAQRLLPLLCVVWAFMCAENTLALEAYEQRRADEQAEAEAKRKPAPLIPRNTIPRRK